MVRVAVLQIQRSSAEEDLETCLRQIDRAAADHGAAIVICPELALDGATSEMEHPQRLLAVQERFAERARTHRSWIALSLTSAHGTLRTWIDPEGVASHEPDATGAVTVSTPHGTLGLCPGRSLLQSSTPRELALSGAALVCAPFAICPASDTALHVPARAVENGVFVAVAALFEAEAAPYPWSSETLPPEVPGAVPSVRGTVSQVVAPNGRPLAVAVIDQTGVAVAEVELGERVELSDGTPLAELRRPELYRVAVVRSRLTRDHAFPGVLRVAAIDVAYEGSSARTVAAAASQIESLAAEGVGLIVLPELFCFESMSVDQTDGAAAEFLQAVRTLSEACRNSAAHVVTSLVEQTEGELHHVGVVVGQAGIVARQRQLHLPRRHVWAKPGRRIECIRMPWGNLVVAVGEDALIPELLRGFSLLGADVVAAPLSGRYQGAAAFILPALADELGIGVIAAVRSEQEPDEARGPTSFIVDPRTWPAQRAIGGERVLQGEVRLRAQGGEPARGHDATVRSAPLELVRTPSDLLADD